MSSEVEDGLEQAAKKLGISSRMPSGAGHDSMSLQISATPAWYSSRVVAEFP